MVRGKGTGVVLSEAERDGLKDEIREIDETIAGVKEDKFGDGGRGGSVNISGMQGEKKRLERLLDESDSAVHLSDKRRDDLIREGKRLIEEMLVGACTKSEMMNRKNEHPGAIQKHLRWEYNNRARAQRYKEIRKIINDDELLPFFDTVRKEK